MRIYEYEIKYIEEKIENCRKRLIARTDQNKTYDFYKTQKILREMEGLERIKRVLCLQERLINDSFVE